MAKKKNKQLIRPWCWYCEREFEDEKVLMQHQKAKHFKCGMCPRRLNTAGGLAVHIQQVHKLEAENLPRIENALPGRDGYEVEIFGMEGIPAPDVADYKRRKEIELGLSAGSISQPQAKRAKIETRKLTDEELAAQLAAHKALMGNSGESSGGPQPESSTPTVYGAPAQTYVSPPVSAPPIGITPPFAGTPTPFPGMPPPGVPPMPPVPGAPILPPPGFPPFAPGFPPGVSPPPGFPVPPFPPGVTPPFPPGPPGVARPPFPPPAGFPPGMPPLPPPGFGQPPPAPPQFVPAQMPGSAPGPPSGLPTQPTGLNSPPRQQGQGQPPQLTLPNPALAQTNPEFKKATVLKYPDPNFSPEERRANDPKYYFDKKSLSAEAPPASATSSAEEPRGKKRARAEDFL